jgi:hypothetical protein
MLKVDVPGLEPCRFTLAGAKLHVAPVGKPVHVSEMLVV